MLDDEYPSPLPLPRTGTQLARDISTVAEKFSRKRSVLYAGGGSMRSIGEDAAKRLGNKQSVLIKQLVSTMKTKREMVGFLLL